ncbi:MAG: hypothetical protein JRJ85_16605 [Deltaproteobacteria bacterium]|nr:hypothetical protein [Deltaproteobacteria bacterium]
MSKTMTGGADMKAVLLKSLVLALVATIFSIPYIYHLILLRPFTSPLILHLGLYKFLVIEMLLLFTLCLLCALIGFSFSQRRGLPGLGDTTGFLSSIPLLLCIACLMTVLSYVFFDRHFFKLSPASYPRNALYLLTFPLKAAFLDELILRFALVTIGIGIFRRRLIGVLFGAVAATLFGLKYLQFIGIPFRLNELLIVKFLLSFTAAFILGYFFVARGLIYSMCLNFLFNLKYAVLSFIL